MACVCRRYYAHFDSLIVPQCQQHDDRPAKTKQNVFLEFVAGKNDERLIKNTLGVNIILTATISEEHRIMIELARDRTKSQTLVY